MFSDETSDVVTLPSTWIGERYLSDSSCQTRDLSYREISTQSILTKEVEIQTEEEEVQDPKQFVLNVDRSQALSNFLLRVYPDVSEQLIANDRSSAFDGYDVNWEDEFEAITCPFKLSHKRDEFKLEVTSISWNSRGTVIAAALGKNDHEGWCTHRSLLCTWNIDMRSIDMNKADKSLDLDSCLMSIAFHPNQPPLIAGGTFNGELIIWDLSNDDDNFIANSARHHKTHQEPISKVFWLANTHQRTRKHELITSSCDGNVFLWEFNEIKKEVQLKKGFVLLTESIPRNLRPPKLRSDTEMGVTSMCFSKYDSDVFFVGSEAGNVFKCSLSSTSKPLQDVVMDGELASPVTLAYEPHIGPVYAVDGSPFHRNLFLSCGTDTTVNLYSILQVEPLLTLETSFGYLFDAKWSSTRPMVLFLASEYGKLLIYDLKANQMRPSNTLEVNTNQSPVYSVQLNPKRPQLIATGDGNGDVCIWSLNDALIHASQNEASTLDSLVTSLGEGVTPSIQD